MIDEAMKKMVSDHVDDQLYRVKAGKKVTYRELFDKHLLESTSELEHYYLFERALADLMAFEEIDLVYAGVIDEGQTLYKRIV